MCYGYCRVNGELKKIGFNIYNQKELEKFATIQLYDCLDSSQISRLKHVFNFYLWCYPLSKRLRNIVAMLDEFCQFMPLDALEDEGSDSADLVRPSKRERNIYDLFVLPLKYLLDFDPKTIIDVGCGDFGGIQDLLDSNVFDHVNGVENPRFSGTKIPFSIKRGCKIFWRDLSSEIKDIPRHDIVITNEVAEHIDEKRAEVFVKNLCNISDVVIFSAATLMSPGDGHINCQNPSYWRSLFEKNKYCCIDLYRIGENVRDYQRVNCFAYVSEDLLVRKGLEVLMRIPSQYIDWSLPREVSEMAKKYVIMQSKLLLLAKKNPALLELFFAEFVPSVSSGCMYGTSTKNEDYRVAMPYGLEEAIEMFGIV